MNCVNKKCGADLQAGAKYCHVCGRKQIKEKRRRIRGNGQGSVYRLPNGKWRAERVIGWKELPLPPGSAPGTPPQKLKITVTDSKFTTKNDALAALPFLTADRHVPKAASLTEKKKTAITLKELHDLWEPTHEMSRSTKNCYRSGFKLFAPLWYTPIEDIDVDDLQECMDASPLGRKVKQNARTCIGLVYKYGIPRNCIPKDRNLGPFLKIRVEDEKENDRSGFTREELDQLRKLAETGDQGAGYVYCHCYLGFRPTAFLALKGEDYNAKEKAFRGGIKTESGIDRTVTVSPKIQSYVDRYVSAHAPGHVFGDQTGHQMSIKAYREEFYAVLDRAGISNPINEQGIHRLTPHSCRHTFATLMKRAQGNDTDKLDLIGHTSTAQLREYQDVDYEDLRKITDQL